jgi:hypothetical protein
MVKPTAASARSADSRPEPGPWTSTSMGLDPVLLRLAAGVLGGHLRRVGRGLARALEAHGPGGRPAMALPWTSEIRILVLLNEEFTWATPAAMFFDTFFLPPRRVASRAICQPHFFLPAMGFAGPCGCGRWCGCAGRARAGCGGAAGRGSSPRSMSRLMFMVVSRRGRPRPRSWRRSARGWRAPRRRQAVHAAALVDADGLADLVGMAVADAVDVGEGDRNPLLGGDVDPGDASQACGPLALRLRSAGAFFHNGGAIGAARRRWSGRGARAMERPTAGDSRLGWGVLKVNQPTVKATRGARPGLSGAPAEHGRHSAATSSISARPSTGAGGPCRSSSR